MLQTYSAKGNRFFVRFSSFLKMELNFMRIFTNLAQKSTQAFFSLVCWVQTHNHPLRFPLYIFSQVRFLFYAAYLIRANLNFFLWLQCIPQYFIYQQLSLIFLVFRLSLPCCFWARIHELDWPKLTIEKFLRRQIFF